MAAVLAWPVLAQAQNQASAPVQAEPPAAAPAPVPAEQAKPAQPTQTATPAAPAQQASQPAPAPTNVAAVEPAATVTQTVVPAPAPNPAPESVPDPQVPPDPIEDQSEEVIEIVDRVAPGAVHRVTAKELERFEYNDVHRVLGAVTGVYIREEDGYGLRPNIGMRGAGSDRSAKIVLMEDGVLISPAPYSAPAAYFFPLITRMQRVEVLKGPASVQFGPNTVGGAVNLVSKDIPGARQASLDIAAGGTAYGKLHLGLAERRKHVAVLLEGIKLRTSGFKELDGGGNTGFDKNEAMLKLRLNTDTQKTVYQQLELKLGYADEVSNETYLGLTDTDFAANPYRRYAASQLDRMSWRHLRMQVAHQVDIGRRFQITTTAYRHHFDRVWTKVEGIKGADSLASVLENPSAGNNAVFYAVLTGQADTLSDAEALVLSTNDRRFISQGIQLSGRTERRLLGLVHQIDLGLRYHQDQVRRLHSNDEYWMMSGQATRRADAATVVTRDEVGSAQALAAFVKDEMRRGPVAVTAGVRAEIIGSDLVDNRSTDTMADSMDRLQSVLIPGIGVVYRPLPTLDVLAGVHRGFVPVSPGQPDSVTPELSVNYEAGARWAASYASLVELIGFVSDYENLKGSCTIAAGCASSEVDDEFNAGSVLITGLEALGQTEVPLGRALRIPLKAAYTLTHARFRTSFTSDNPQWGRVEAGDVLPYVPAHQLTLQAGLAGAHWDVMLSGRYTSAMRDVAGSGDPMPEERTDAVTVLDLAAGYRVGRWGALYLTMDNLLDEAHIVARRPYGARPGKPRMLMVGYKNTF